MLILLGLVVVFINFVGTLFDDTANTPEPEPKSEKPNLEKATVQITGDDGGTFDLSISHFVQKPGGGIKKKMKELTYTGEIEPDPNTYPVDLSKFESNGDNDFLGGDIDIEAKKTKPWEGDLIVLLEVNDTIVECESISETEPDYDASFSFDADEPMDYEGDFFCKLYLWLY